MKPIEIDLSEPFEKVLARVLAAPANSKTRSQKSAEPGVNLVSPKQGDLELKRTAEVKKVVRCLYEAAHGRQVETHVGLIPIAPPIAAFLKEKPLYIRTQVDFLLAALTRIIEMCPRVSQRPSARLQSEAVRKPSTFNRSRSFKGDDELSNHIHL